MNEVERQLLQLYMQRDTKQRELDTIDRSIAELRPLIAGMQYANKLQAEKEKNDDPAGESESLAPEPSAGS